MRALRKRSLNLNRHNTSLALEPEFWEALDTMSRDRGLSFSALLNEIDEPRADRPMASACRVAVLQWALAR
jgi:predicted DNA-binding ribbon-helix-helix protein